MYRCTLAVIGARAAQRTHPLSERCHTMPNPYFNVGLISRSHQRSSLQASAYGAGQTLASSVVASAAYRSKQPLRSDQLGQSFDYSSKAEEVVHTAILAPQNAPAWMHDRERLWNAVEKKERRKDAQLARSLIASLPRELTHDQQIALAERFVQTCFVDQGMVADVALHDKTASDGKAQPHLHVLLTMRHLEADGFGKKNRSWNDRTLVQEWRDIWERMTNEALEAAGDSARLSLKSYAERGINRLPTLPMGYRAAALEQRGVFTTIGMENKRRKNENRLATMLPGYVPVLHPPDQKTIRMRIAQDTMQHGLQPPEMTDEMLPPDWTPDEPNDRPTFRDRIDTEDRSTHER